jgi:hypothetical protein
MRIDKNDRRQAYNDSLDWLQRDEHIIWLLSLFFAYAYYLLTTEEA